ncbi:helix-turn-helix domain-containing protein [Microcoleus sp. M2_B4]|uniref:helix-turn-helix domain-containing protein n=1 Tax=Microcoleus sp. M2_D1 TaxID=3055373 RepID=UPI002FD070BC
MQGRKIADNSVCLEKPFPYYQIARSIGITYEECVRLFKKLKPFVCYIRGGKIIVLDWKQLEDIASEEEID